MTWWSKTRAAIRDMLKKLVPLGYEDEAGFHLGVEPAAHRQKQTAR